MATPHTPGLALGDRRLGLWSAVAAWGMALLVLAVAGLPPGYPVNDSAAYHRMVELWWQNGHPTFIGWNEMTLLGHLAPAVLLRALVSGSIAALQIAVGLGAALVTAILAALLVRSGRRPAEAVPLALCWLASPVALVSATSFMTEVPQALWCAAWLAAFAWWCRTGRVVAAVAWAAFAVAAFSVRQTGVVLPIAAVAASFVGSRPRRVPAVVVALAALAADGALWAFRATLPLATVRPLSHMVGDLAAGGLVGGFAVRLAEALAMLGLFLVPVAVALAARLGRAAVNRTGALLAAAVAVLLGLAGSGFPFWPNTVAVTGLLPDTLPPHGALAPVLPWWLLAGLTVLGVASVAVLASRVLDRRRLREPMVAAATAATVGLLILATLPQSPFDRYLVPVVPLALVAVAAGPSGGLQRRVWPLPAIGALLLVLVASAASVRHLHERQRAVWRIAQEQVAAGVPAAAVDGGFEWNLWHQQVPFDPAEVRDAGRVLVWYESYPFTRLQPQRRLWIGLPPAGWQELSRRHIPGGLEVLVVTPVGESTPGPETAARLEAVRSEIHDHIVAAWTRALAEPGHRQPALSAVEGEELVFYWDTYFTNAGLLRRPELVILARANVDFLLGQVEARGFAPNANRPWGMNRSQPPYLAMMAELSMKTGGCIKVDLKAWDGSIHSALCGVSNRKTLENFRFLAGWTKQRPSPPFLLASTLLVPGYVDEQEVGAIAAFLADLSPEIPYSLLGFYPHFRLRDLPTTSRRHALRCKAAAESHGLRNVHIGNRHLLGEDY